MGKTMKLCFAAVLGGTLVFSASAEEPQPLEELTAVAAEFLQQEIFAHDASPEITVGRIDSRLRLPMCGEPLTGFCHRARPGPEYHGGDPFDGAKPWSIYVSAKVRLMRPVLVLVNPVSRGQVMGESESSSGNPGCRPAGRRISG